ncbi:translocation/assembly module TamB domain-containing protein [Pustulibacterium marinum]|uniref:translocation/assembly module TamB domain-containing protein n=1 Tax=Pustulibacterium marinum TaxID=1224947 RepID=UPI001FE475EE|nr:translocation/assembly module TamB domain-containing protein [Pustulibacterium marinum]
MEDKGKTYSGIKKLRKILLRILAGILIFLLLLVIALSLPPVQTFIAKKVTNSLNESYGTSINIDKIHVTFYGDVYMKSVFIKDYEQDTLIYVKKLSTSLLSVKKIFDSNLDFGDVDLEDPVFNIRTYKGESNSNLDVFVAKLEGNDTTTSTTPFILEFSNIDLENGKFRFIDENSESPVKLNFGELFTEIEDFKLEGPNVTASINHMGFLTETGLRVDKLAGDFAYTKEQMKLTDFEISTKKSKVTGNVYFDYERKDFADFMNKVKVSGNFKNSLVNLDDVNMFYDEFGKDKTVVFSTNVSGTLNELKTTDLNVVSETSFIKGDYNFSNLFDSDKPYKIEGSIENITSNYYQLAGLLPNLLGHRLPSNFSRFGQFTIQGKTTIAESYLNTDIKLTTQIGTAISNLSISNINDIDNASYKGHIILEDFNVSKYTRTESIGKVSLAVDVDGKGFNQKNLNTEVRGKISKLNYNKYTYRNAVIRGRLQNQLFNGYLKSYDKNFQFTFQGLADFSSEENIFAFNTSVGYADLNALNFVKRDSISQFKGNINIDLSGNDIDNMKGSIKFTKTSYINQNNDYYFDDFAITSKFDQDNVRTIDINSPDIVSGSVEGKFKFNQIIQLVENSIGSIYPNYNPHKIDKDQFINFHFKIYDKIIDVFYPEVEFAANTNIRGSIKSENNMFKLNFQSPQIDVFGYVMDDINLRVDNKNPLYNTFIEVGSVKNKYYDIKDFNLINSTINDTLFFRTEFAGTKNDADKFNLNFYHTFNKNQQSVVGLKTSDVTFKGNTWYLNQENNIENKVVFDKKLDSIIIKKIVMNHDDEIINLKGKVIDTTYKDVNLQFSNVQLANITPSIDSLSMAGVVNGDFTMLQKNKVYLPTSNLMIKDFVLNDHELGDFNASIIGNESLTDYNVNIEILNENIESLNINGNINFDDGKENLDLIMNLRNLDIAPFSPLGGIVLSDMRGVVTGDATITGKVSNPEINGLLNLFGAGLKIPYLGLDVDFSEASKVVISEGAFNFDNVTLTDTAFNTSALLDGSIMHRNFEDWSLDLGLITNNERFLVLNTEDDGETLFYGTAFMRGTADIYGSVDALTIDVTGTTESGTSFKIPINDAVSIGDDSFIEFINKHESREAAAERKLKEYSGLELNFDLTVNPKAEIEIVTDRKTGSTLRGRGEGTLLMEINTNGKFNMWGDFITTEGTYNFKNYGLINKTFTVQPGGSITWEGDPTRATLRDLKAMYSLNANPSLLLENNQFNRKIRTNVIINLDGELMNPTTSFDIEFPDTNPVMASELNYRLQDNNQRQLQAIYLLSSGTFVGDNTNAALQGVATTTLSESLFSQINNQLGGSDNKLNIGLSYEVGVNSPTYDYRTDDQFGVTISTQISDRILFNGKIGVPVGGVTETVVAGDAEVQILLNDEGTLSAKVFNKQTEIQDFLASTQGYTQGVGLSYQVDFDTFGELWRIIFNGKKEEEEYLDNDPEQERKAREAAEKQKQAENKVIETQGDNGLVKMKSKNSNSKKKDNSQ